MITTYKILIEQLWSDDPFRAATSMLVTRVTKDVTYTPSLHSVALVYVSHNRQTKKKKIAHLNLQVFDWYTVPLFSP